MKLLVISHTPHHRDAHSFVGWGPTVREIDRLAGLFDEVIHVAPVHPGPAPASGLAYQASNIRVVAVPPAGGESLGRKIDIVRVLPRYARAILKELRRCDVVHVRCPSNIGLIAALLLSVRRKPERRWIKYAGNWRPGTPEGWSYAFQRWLLRGGLTRAFVTVNGRWPDQSAGVHSFLNPCLTGEELQEGALLGAKKGLGTPLRLLFIGRVEEEKGCGRAIELARELSDRGIRVVLDVVGDGEERVRFERMGTNAGLLATVRFTGWLARTELARLYGEAHFLILPSICSEGWPKVISEGMAYGVVPLASRVSCIPQYLDEFGAGRALNAFDRGGFADAVASYVAHPAEWKRESMRAMDAARRFTYDSYLSAVRRLLSLDGGDTLDESKWRDAAVPRMGR